MKQTSYDACKEWGVREAGIVGLRVASSVQQAICNEVYGAEIVTQVAEDRSIIESDRTERVDGSAAFDTKVALLVQTSRATTRCGWSLSRVFSTSCREGRPLRILAALV